MRLFFVLVVIVISNYVIVAQTTLTGDWKSQTESGKNPDKVYFEI